LIHFDPGAITLKWNSEEGSLAFKTQKRSFPKSMNERIAVLCPELSVPEKTIELLVPLFDAVKIGRPWFMDEEEPFLKKHAVQILRPPDELKPPGDFKRLVAEYKGWVRTSREKGFDAFLAFQEHKSYGQEATWDIRREVRRGGDLTDEDRKKNALKWNLFLCLAHEIRVQENEAEDLLKTLKEKDSPLKGLSDEEELPHPLSELPEREGLPMRSEAGMGQVLESWFSLFEGHLSGEDILLTLSPGVFQYLCDLWEEWGEGPAAGAALKDAVVLRQFPLLEKSPVNVIARHLSGKTIGRIRDPYLYGK